MLLSVQVASLIVDFVRVSHPPLPIVLAVLHISNVIAAVAEDDSAFAEQFVIHPNTLVEVTCFFHPLSTLTRSLACFIDLSFVHSLSILAEL